MARAGIDRPAARVEIGPGSRVAAAADVVVVVAAVVVAAREKAPWARRATAVPKVPESASTRNQRSAAREKVSVAASKWPTVTIITMSTAKVGTPATSITAKSN